MIEYVTPVIASVGLIGGTLGILHHFLSTFKDMTRRMDVADKNIAILRRRSHKLRNKLCAVALKLDMPELEWSGSEQALDESTDEEVW